jgi:toxin ParE1/3/4
VKLIWAAHAKQDLLNLTHFLVQRNPEGARAVITAIWKAAGTLRDYPNMGKETGQAGQRELVIPHSPYVIVYQPASEHIDILRIFHGTQNRTPA